MDIIERLNAYPIGSAVLVKFDPAGSRGEQELGIVIDQHGTVAHPQITVVLMDGYREPIFLDVDASYERLTPVPELGNVFVTMGDLYEGRAKIIPA